MNKETPLNNLAEANNEWINISGDDTETIPPTFDELTPPTPPEDSLNHEPTILEPEPITPPIPEHPVQSEPCAPDLPEAPEYPFE